MTPDKPNGNEQAADKPTIENEPSAPDLKEYQRILKELGSLADKNMKDPRSNYRSYEQIEYEI